MGDWEDNRPSSRRYERGFDQRRDNRRERDTHFYKRSNTSSGDNWNNDSSTYNNSYRREYVRGSNDNSTNGLVMYVDTNNVGKIVGRGGSKIKALESESNARIKVSRILSQTIDVVKYVLRALCIVHHTILYLFIYLFIFRLTDSKKKMDRLL